MSLPNPLRVLATIIAALSTVLIAAAVCFACDCNTLSAPESFNAADFVFVGTVVNSASSASEINSTFRVEQVLKGTNTGQAVITGHRSDCDFPFQRGDTYIVYARQADGKFMAGICMATKLVRSEPLIHYTSPPRYGYRAIVAGVILLLALVVGYIVGRAWPRAT
jgi:hypothetical protein